MADSLAAIAAGIIGMLLLVPALYVVSATIVAPIAFARWLRDKGRSDMMAKFKRRRR